MSIVCLFALLFGLTLGDTYTGYIVDNFCWDQPNNIAVDGADLKNDPSAHTVDCMTKLANCRNSGFGLLQKTSGGTYTLQYKFNDAGNQAVLMQLDATSTKSGYMATVTGIVGDASTTPPTLDVSSIVGASASGSEITWTGFLADNLCLGMPGGIAIDGAHLITSPQDHTVSCMLLPNCLQSGFALLGDTSLSASSPTYQVVYKLDSKGNDLAATALQGTSSTNNFMVTATGVPDNSNPPVLAVTALTQVAAAANTTTPSPSVSYSSGLTIGQTVGVCIASAFGFLILVTVLGVIKAVM